ncbi:MAG TPA: hypothetical protein PLI09_00870 [Candidatus Hydrogenedentes bacterium]|nr:hypothetical protein [Candidatus Hydrogenedentota bacterium]
MTMVVRDRRAILHPRPLPLIRLDSVGLQAMIFALRREKSGVPSMTFDLLTIDPPVQWKSEDYDSGKTWVISGKQLREEGFTIDIPNRRDSRLLFYSADHTDKP